MTLGRQTKGMMTIPEAARWCLGLVNLRVADVSLSTSDSPLARSDRARRRRLVHVRAVVVVHRAERQDVRFAILGVVAEEPS